MSDLKEGDIVWWIDIVLRESRVIRNPLLNNLDLMPLRSEEDVPHFIAIDNKNEAIDGIIKLLESQRER